MSPPAPWTTTRTLRVVTFHVKDMYWLSDHRAERTAAIGDALVRGRPDVVCLQEGFVAGDIAGLDHVLRWQPMLPRRYGRDHVQARSCAGVHRFTPLGEVAIDGRVAVAGEPKHAVSLSDHTGPLAELRIEPVPR